MTALRAREIDRRYLALVRGRLPSPSGTIEAPLGRHPTKRRLFAVVPEGRHAVTHYRVLAEGDDCSLVEATLETGRTHQIRVHLAYLGHPVVGDRVYGGRSELSERLGLRRPFLHAYRLAFPHPGDGRRIDLEDPLPEDLEAALREAGLTLPA